MSNVDEVYVMLMMMRADENANIVEGCTAEELLACIAGDNYDECVASCGSEEPEEEVKPGFIKVTKVGSTSTDEVPANAVNKKIGSIKLTAGDNDTTVNSIVISHAGLGNASDVSLKLGIGSTFVSRAKKMATNADATVKFSPALVIKAGKSETVDIYATLTTLAANSTHEFSVVDVNVTNGKAEGTPIKLGSLKTTSYIVGNANFEIETATSSFTAGDTDKKIMTVSINPTRDANVDGFTVYSDNAIASTIKVDEAFENVKAYYNNEEIGTVTLKSDAIIVSNLNKQVAASDGLKITLKGDCMNIKGGTFTWDNDESSVNAQEVKTNENMQTVESTAAGLAVTIASVDISFYDNLTESPKVSINKNRVKLFDATLKTTSTFDVSKFTLNFAFDGSSTLTTLDDMFKEESVSVYVNGELYENLDQTKTVDSYTYLFDDDLFTVNEKNPLTIEVYGNISNIPALLGETIDVTANITEITNDEGDKVSGTPIISLAGKTTTIAAATLKIKPTAKIPSTNVIAEGQQKAPVLYFDLSAEVDKFDITSVKITKDANLAAATNEVVLMKGGKKMASVASTDANWIFTFDDTVAEGETNSYVVVADIKDNVIANVGKQVSVGVEKVNTDTTYALTAPKTYTISSDLPSVVLSDRDDEFTTITINNTSDYDDIVVTSLDIKVTPIIENLPKDMISLIFDSIKVHETTKNGTVVSNIAATTQGTYTIDFDTNANGSIAGTEFVFNDDDSIVVELANSLGMLGTWYKLEVVSVSYQYEESAKYYPGAATAITTANSIVESYSESL